MHITKIELEDIKCHADSTFEFNSGTTAITGENGAGKTSLIEAVAWTLFDFLDYKKDDFVRRGAKKGVARVTFESGLDEREYTVYRDTYTGYYVYDPKLKIRIAEKKEEVLRFLWQHMGVEPGTDLESLYRRAIGVPQGTYTAIFLENAAERKKAFDKLLKVEEYRRGADELLKTSRYLEQQINGVREKIARAEGELNNADVIESNHKIAAARASELAAEFEVICREAAEQSETVRKLDEIANKIDKLRAEFDNLASGTERANLLFAQHERDLNAAIFASRKLSEVEAENLQHQESLSRLKELERERLERDKLQAELSKVESAIANVKSDQRRFQDNLESVSKAHHTIEVLKPKAGEQERLEEELEGVRNKAAGARAITKQIASLDVQLARLRESYKANQSQLAEAQIKSTSAADLDELQHRDSEIVLQLAQLRASLDRDEKFQREIKNGLCPILSQKCLNLKNGETLEMFVTSQFSDIRSEISVFELQQKSVADSLRASREAQKFLQALEVFNARAKEISDEGTHLNTEIDALRTQLEDLPAIEIGLKQIEAALAVLDNPKAKLALMQKEISREFELREAVTKIESNLERLDSDRSIKIEQLESYKDLDLQWAACSQQRDQTADAHRVFVANEAAASLRSQREKEFEAAKEKLSSLQKSAERAEKELADADGSYDRETHLNDKALLLASERKKAEIGATLDAVKSRESELVADLARLTETRKAMQAEYIEKERLEKIAEATTFIRETLKEAAPRVARNYVHHVSLEANQMFREISGNAEHSLKWTEDYGIMLEENGHDRPFVSLSGGEQMAAALSVRLALLKQLSDIRIAFFDEPTTNMDAERRENLAVQISQIKHFEQLFVISHDDTFEGYTDNVITVRGNGND